MSKVRSAVMGAVSALALTAIFAAPAQAVQVTFSDVTGLFQNVVPAAVPGLSFTNQNTGDPSIRWGVPLTQAGKSGYDFNAATPPPIVVDVPPSPSNEFILGDFTHVNQTIEAGTSITGAQLALTMDVSIGGVDQGNRVFLFDISHEETPNNANPCAAGGNIPCPDRITISTANDSEFFSVGGADYWVNILGFLVNGNFVNQFITAEGADNEAQLLANVTTVTRSVPEPASLFLLGTALLGFGVFRRNARFSV